MVTELYLNYRRSRRVWDVGTVQDSGHARAWNGREWATLVPTTGWQLRRGRGDGGDGFGQVSGRHPPGRETEKLEI